MSADDALTLVKPDIAYLTAYIAALQRGWSRLVLETGTGQPDAVRFYTREGFTPIPKFGYYADSADSLCYGKTLAPHDPAADAACEGCD